MRETPPPRVFLWTESSLAEIVYVTDVSISGATMEVSTIDSPKVFECRPAIRGVPACDWLRKIVSVAVVVDFDSDDAPLVIEHAVIAYVRRQKVVIEEIPPLCPKCSHAVVAGPTGRPVCDECGWHGRPARQDGAVTPLYGCAGGPGRLAVPPRPFFAAKIFLETGQ